MTEPKDGLVPLTAIIPANAATSQITMPGRMMLEELFVGDGLAHVREDVIQTGRYETRDARGKVTKSLRMQVKKTEDGRHEIMAMAALSREPGRTQDAIDTIQDFTTAAPNRQQQVAQYKRIYKTEGIINNAVNKITSLVASSGRFKVRKARKGKIRKPIEGLQAALDFVTKNVNNSPEDAVITSNRGMKAVVISGARQALVEGDWVARQQWSKVQIGEFGSFSLPMIIQSISMENLEPNKDLAGLGELWYWVPPATLLQLLTGDQARLPKEVKEVLKKLVDTDTLGQLKKTRRALLDPSLMMHIKYRGFATEAYGESLIESAKLGIRYDRAITAADLVSMENIINRLTIVQVGSADPASPYSKSDVSAARAALMQSFFEEPAANMVIVWQGDDIKVEDVGTQQQLLSLDERYAIAERKVKLAMGLPDSLLLGSSTTGASADQASIIGSTAQILELVNAFSVVLGTLGERIALENGYEGVDLIWEPDNSLMENAQITRTNNRSDYVAGLASIHSTIAATGKDPDAEFRIRCEERGLDPETTTFEDAFMPPQGLQGQGAGEIPGQGGGRDPGQGRTTNEQSAAPPAVKKPAPK